VAQNEGSEKDFWCLSFVNFLLFHFWVSVDPATYGFQGKRCRPPSANVRDLAARPEP